MANCCINNITFYSTEKAKIERLYNDFLVAWNKEDETGQTLSSEYLIIKSMGYDYNGKVVIDGRDCVTYLDEEVRELELDDMTLYHFELCTETAYVPNMQMLKALINEEAYKGIELVHLSEECGCELYVNTDDTGLFYGTRYCIWADLNDECENHYEADFKDLVKIIKSDFPNADITEDDTIGEIERKIEPFISTDDSYTIYEYAKEYQELTYEEEMAWRASIRKSVEAYREKQSA